VPGIIVAAFTGDRGDIAGRHTCKDGVRTVEYSRKLVTGSEFDVQFNDLKKEYASGVAILDNAQVCHAFSAGVFKLKFEETPLGGPPRGAHTPGGCTTLTRTRAPEPCAWSSVR
jgi:hypothetical protein